mgnify:CR=1 FL=1
MCFPFMGMKRKLKSRCEALFTGFACMGGQKRKKVLCLDRGMDEETKRVCKLTARDTQMVEICSEEELANLLKRSFANT